MIDQHDTDPKYRFYSTCVGWPERDVHREGGLCDLIDVALEISRRTFLKYVDREEQREIEQGLSYALHPKQGLTMAQDWHVRYFRSRWHGRRVYGFWHSGIEYVFVRETHDIECE